MPKRTKQMGGIEQRLRIFVEDYVYTYLYQYGRSGGGAEKLAALVTTPAADFDSTNENVQFKLLGMYGDDSQAMLSFQVTAMDGAALQDGLALPYQLLLLDADGGSETLDCYGRTVDVREKDGAYYINLRITRTCREKHWM